MTTWVMITFVVLAFTKMVVKQEGGRGGWGCGSPYPQNIKDCKEVII